MRQEFHRVIEECEKLGASSSLIDRIYVPNLGMIHPMAQSGIAEEKDSGQALLHFYHALFEFSPA